MYARVLERVPVCVCICVGSGQVYGSVWVVRRPHPPRASQSWVNGPAALWEALGKAKAKGVNPDEKSGVEPLRRLDDELHHHFGNSCSPVVARTLCLHPSRLERLGPRGGSWRLGNLRPPHTFSPRIQRLHSFSLCFPSPEAMGEWRRWQVQDGAGSC